MDAGNMLKPALARGDLHCMGATTLNEYREYIEKDAALERRFQKVLVDEPSDSSINKITCPCSASNSFNTAFNRSSNSPRYFAPATNAAISNDNNRSDKGDSYLSTELFLLAIISGNDTTTKLLKDLGVDKKSLSTAMNFTITTNHRVKFAVLCALC
jgi:ATP-dependent Clp protease ATP-binding subunit ClpA